METDERSALNNSNMVWVPSCRDQWVQDTLKKALELVHVGLTIQYSNPCLLWLQLRYDTDLGLVLLPQEKNPCPPKHELMKRFYGMPRRSSRLSLHY
jgi:hypothetical protein